VSAERVGELDAIGAFARDLVVQAGAGTGKTHALVTLYLHLVTGLSMRPGPLSPGRILVITFTDKAAGELRERIAARLARVVEEGITAEPTLVAAARALGREPTSARLLRRALVELGRAPIGTFHAFGRAFLRRHAFVAALDPELDLLDEAEARLRSVDAARAAVLAALEAADPAVEALVDQLGFGGRDGAGLVDVVADLRGRRAEEGRSAVGLAAAYEPVQLADERARALRATRDALAAFAGLGDAVGKLSAPRLHVLAGAAGADELGDGRAGGFLASLRAELSALRATKGAGDALRDVRERYKEASEALLAADAAIEAAPRARALEQLVGDAAARYAGWKRGARCADFADLITVPRDLLRDRTTLLAEEASRYEALLVDEFQDTNVAQAELVRLLAQGVSGQGVGGRQFVVGDRKQSIYEFRGADVGVFTTVTESLRASGATEVVLRRSFRSAPAVVALCNELFARAFDVGPRSTAWSLSFERERDGLLAQRAVPSDSGAELLRVPRADDDKTPADVLRRAEARAIAQRMRALLDSGRRPGELALLLRRYTHLPTYLAALARAGLPYYVVRGRGFYEAQEIRDVASLLLLLHDGDDRLALVAVLRSPLCGLSDDGLLSLEGHGALRLGAILRGERADLDADDRGRLDALAARVLRLRAVMARLGPTRLLGAIVDDFDLRAILAGQRDGVQRIANLEQLIARAATLEEDPSGPAGDLPRFARWIARAVRPLAALEASAAQVVDERDDVIRVMSIHQAKGLEFPVVFVADCGAQEMAERGRVFYDADEGLGLMAPSDEPGEWRHTTASARVRGVREARRRAESLRLFYVAATRAADRVVFSGERGRAAAGWRRELDDLLAAPGGAALLTVVDARPLSAVPAPSAPIHSVPLSTLPALEPFAPRRARSLEVAVTQLQDFALCARRHFLFHELRLEEHTVARLPGAPPIEADEDGELGDPLRAGTLAHRLLEHCRFGLDRDTSREHLRALLRAEGYDPDEAPVQEIAAHVLGFLATPFARALAQKTVRRELPFVLALPSARGTVRLLRGQIDLLVFDEQGVEVVDYKHARRADPDDYRFQLEAYALAARTLYPRAPRVAVGLSWLRESDPTPIWVEPRDPAQGEARLGALADALADARLRGERPGIARPGCERIRCGYLAWCHREENDR
jgi:ATP-dependent exoDNAse (exonuclease V) beta subunit